MPNRRDRKVERMDVRPSITSRTATKPKSSTGDVKGRLDSILQDLQAIRERLTAVKTKRLDAKPQSRDSFARRLLAEDEIETRSDSKERSLSERLRIRVDGKDATIGDDAPLSERLVRQVDAKGIDTEVEPTSYKPGDFARRLLGDSSGNRKSFSQRLQGLE